MQTFHIHIQGIVQGVGFRPFVYQIALQQGLKGWVNNTNDGVHIQITETEERAQFFLDYLLEHLPTLAVVTHCQMEITTFQEYTAFDIVESTEATKPKLLVTPDVALCKDCKAELHDTHNRRYHYPFITCTNCGPRYSIIQKLPYDRPHTTMYPFHMCPTCQKEYNNPMERRHFSQTNSCPECKVEMQLCIDGSIVENFEDLNFIINQWQAGKIIAIKGIGGYLLTCDATQVQAVETLRTRKHRPNKPFALMYPSLELLQRDAFVSDHEAKELHSIASPIVLLQTQDALATDLALEAINKGLSKIGVMLPYTPLLELLLHDFGKPIVATSANISNSTILFEDDKAQRELASIADLILMNNRAITVPQDDGVVQFTPLHHLKITLRRSRGKAPIYINPQLELPSKSIFAPGAMLKSVFGFIYEKNIYISQYLGNTESYDAQQNYEQTFQHLQNIFQIPFDNVITDLHPDYFATRFGKELAQINQVEPSGVQHHKAHFWSVLGEHNLIHSKTPILGVIWDGTGLGEDGHIWGGEFFKFENGNIDRVGHLEEFPFILGDKMPKEPRIAAFALGHQLPESEPYLKSKFTDTEWQIYKKLVTQTSLRCSSMGRLFDAVASLLFGYDIHSFEAEASMRLENEASHFFYHKDTNLTAGIKETSFDRHSYLNKTTFPTHFVNFLYRNIIEDLNKGVNKQLIAFKFHLTLVDYIEQMAIAFGVKQMAFSGGVFQNALLVDLIYEKLHPNFKLYFHQEFSPNDEGIAFGQLLSLTELM